MLAAVRTARDRMIVTWLADCGLRIGELCGLWFCELHLRAGHPCGQRRGPHLHVVKRINPNAAAAKRGYPARLVDGIVTDGIVRRASPAMVDSYHEYLAEDYHRIRALVDSEVALVQPTGERTGAGLSPHGARQMLERAGRRAGLGLVNPHAFRHTWATALTEATDGNTKAVADAAGGHVRPGAVGPLPSADRGTVLPGIPASRPRLLRSARSDLRIRLRCPRLRVACQPPVLVLGAPAPATRRAALSTACCRCCAAWPWARYCARTATPTGPRSLPGSPRSTDHRRDHAPLLARWRRQGGPDG